MSTRVAIATKRLRLGLIDPSEVLEHQPPLLGRQPGQLVPRGVAHLGTGSCRSRTERGRYVHAIAGRGTADPLLLVVRFLARETAAGIEELAIELLLPVERPPIQPARFELAREIARFLRQCSGRT